MLHPLTPTTIVRQAFPIGLTMVGDINVNAEAQRVLAAGQSRWAQLGLTRGADLAEGEWGAIVRPRAEAACRQLFPSPPPARASRSGLLPRTLQQPASQPWPVCSEEALQAAMRLTPR